MKAEPYSYKLGKAEFLDSGRKSWILDGMLELNVTL